MLIRLVWSPRKQTEWFYLEILRKTVTTGKVIGLYFLIHTVTRGVTQLAVLRMGPEIQAISGRKKSPRLVSIV